MAELNMAYEGSVKMLNDAAAAWRETPQ